MATNNPAVRLQHIRDELAWVLPRSQAISYDVFAADIVLVRAVERAILIISEAAKTLPADMTARYPEIEWHAVRGIGNVLRHEYERVETRLLWSVVTKSLPVLSPIIDKMLAEIV